MIRLRPALHLVTLIGCAATSAGCHEWVVRDPNPETALQAYSEKDGKLRLTVDNGERIEFEQPVIRDDSIVQRAQVPRLPAIATARADVTKVETRGFSLGRTVFAVVGAALAYPVAYIAYYVACGCYDN